MSVTHGANLFDLANKLGIDRGEILDFSSNINPFGASKKAKEAVINNIDMVSIYPDPEYKNLKSSISKYCNCKSENILLGGGATELISSFIETVNPKRALLVAPAYSEYEKELKKIGCKISKYFAKKENDFKINVKDLKKRIEEESFNLVIICNPNNPTGFAFTKEEIREIVKETKAFVMVDETYIEFTYTKDYSATTLVDEYENLFVIRGTSKFFSTPGIRLGYGLISSKAVKDKILANLDLWNINIFATLMGEEMFKDTEYINSTITHMTNERKYLNEELGSIDWIKNYDSKGNFILCEIKKEGLTADYIYDKLVSKKIIIRNCKSFEGLDNKFFRVCVLKHNENELLINELKKIN
ncbi:pyridoxal phosphate-dependent aminotransferase [Eubacterium multiforme]|uniref:Threonine-phosphate decarboxylase n=1 Tax=Eubacterium multiforme TaxID=83339 RepID=A0ABT9UPB1_9FIRM|nr:histidinol-phosphate transaminase [Eubacterium multiforme]MDQ0148480.1 threonine-phosphate decarboxylase [Eubacterium multiforme]